MLDQIADPITALFAMYIIRSLIATDVPFKNVRASPSVTVPHTMIGVVKTADIHGTPPTKEIAMRELEFLKSLREDDEHCL